VLGNIVGLCLSSRVSSVGSRGQVPRPSLGQGTCPSVPKAIKSNDLMAFFFFHPNRHREVGDEKYDDTSDFNC